jgi:hypothetical protein
MLKAMCIEDFILFGKRALCKPTVLLSFFALIGLTDNKERLWYFQVMLGKLGS